ncbi:mechanosensitive ion channel family protein [Variovorax sp. PBL-E5]|uniref:mechanosensitive ion channel family protein n=1 Tax=Variovorax sp. PBL-E5 TaxID=434014 RepID=UPI0013177502|nr:hypothetical protein E5CHR_03052 [Variovorax sp. PBL-E5]
MNEFTMYLEPVRAFLIQIGAFIPRLLFAAAVVVAGWLIAKVVRFAVVRMLRAINFHVLTERAGIDNFLRQGGMRSDTTGLFGVLAYWFVILAALLVAFNGLGLTYVTDLLGRVVWFVPNLFVALLILAFGAYFARFVGDAVTTYGRNANMQDGFVLGKLAQYAILVFVVLIALDQVKVGGDIVRLSFLVILAGVVFALALAFGLAGKDWAAERIDHWWPRNRPEPGLRAEATPPDTASPADLPVVTPIVPTAAVPGARRRSMWPTRAGDRSADNEPTSQRR